MKQAALVHVASERIQKLAKPKDVHPEYLMERVAPFHVTPGAKKCVSNNRTHLPSHPKMHQKHIRTETSLGHFPVSIAAMRANASEHTVRLAQPKKCNALYKGQKEIPWAVTNSAKKAEPSSKIKLLARPRPRPIINKEYDPFTVTLPALQAIATFRINVLSIPLARRCSPKNVFTARVKKSVGVY